MILTNNVVISLNNNGSFYGKDFCVIKKFFIKSKWAV